jgi:hypothetical protein
MLVDNKFIYLSLPRCASTSFLISCLRSDINFERYDDIYYGKPTIDLKLDNENLADQLLHGHEKLVDLQKKFGPNYPIVGIKRNKYDRFVSVWKHLIDLAHNLTDIYPPEVSKILSKLTIDDILFYKSEDLIYENKDKLIDDFIKRNGLTDYINSKIYSHFYTMIFIAINPLSYYHNNDPKIIWFDYDNMREFEKWVSNMISKPFKLEKSNSSKHYKSNLEVNLDLMRKYDEIYGYFDTPKKEVSLI